MNHTSRRLVSNWAEYSVFLKHGELRYSKATGWYRMRDRPGQKSKLLPQYHLFFNKSQQFLPTAINCWTLSAIAGNSQLLSAICNNTQTQLLQIPTIGCNSSSCHFGNSILLDSPIFSPLKTLPRYSTIVNICQQSSSLQPSLGPNNIQQLLTISQGHRWHSVVHPNMT